MTNTYRVAIYCRLSRDDNNGSSESMSINNQKQILTDYVARQGWNLHGIYIDDGYSGTNFDRPDFQRMIGDIERGLINCVITKDLSRLGRNYAKTGYYTDEFFLENGVRYIALNDNVDTMKSENDFAAFHNVINEFYPREISRKVRQVKRRNAASGLFCGGYAPYGYMQQPDNKHVLTPNPETEPIVKRIFDLFIHGHSLRGIANLLNEELLPCPSYYHFLKTGRSYGHKDAATKRWSANTIKTILKNPVYLGKMVQGKRVSLSYKSKKRVMTDRDSWYEVENTHEAIISQSIWSQANLFFEESGNHRTPIASKACDGNIPIFSGMIFCKDCGARMSPRKMRNGKIAYRCSRYVSSGGSACNSHHIREADLLSIIQDDLSSFAALNEEQREALISQLLMEAGDCKQNEKARLLQEKKRLMHREQELMRILQSLYEDKLKGVIEQDLFRSMADNFQQEKKEGLEKAEKIELKLNAFRNIESSSDEWAANLDQYLQAKQLDYALASQLIDRVEISMAQTKDDNAKCQIDITYRFGNQGHKLPEMDGKKETA